MTKVHNTKRTSMKRTTKRKIAKSMLLTYYIVKALTCIAIIAIPVWFIFSIVEVIIHQSAYLSGQVYEYCNLNLFQLIF